MSQDAIIAQYRECYEYLRQHDRVIWQIPSIVATINGVLIVVAFRYIQDLVVREVLIGVGMVLTIALSHANVKHRYFAIIGQQSLTPANVRRLSTVELSLSHTLLGTRDRIVIRVPTSSFHLLLDRSSLIVTNIWR